MPTLINASENYFCTLNSTGAIQLVGEQTDTYLQGQVSVNLELLSETKALLACHCDFKGKMWNANYLIRHNNHIDFLVKKSALPSSLSELKKYGVFSKVDITDISDSTVFVGMGGEDVKAKLLTLFPALSDEHQSVVSNTNGWVLTLNTANQLRYLCAFENNQDVLKKLTASLTEKPETLWDSMDIIDGVAPIFEATSNEYVPQMLNMQILNAIDFNKGCYMGQEVVARTKYLGKNKRATYLLTTSLDNSSAPLNVSTGDLLEKAIGENWRRGGTIVHASQYQSVIYILAVLSNDTDVGDSLRLKDAPDITLKITALPYSVDKDLEKK